MVDAGSDTPPLLSSQSGLAAQAQSLSPDGSGPLSPSRVPPPLPARSKPTPASPPSLPPKPDSDDLKRHLSLPPAVPPRNRSTSSALPPQLPPRTPSPLPAVPPQPSPTAVSALMRRPLPQSPDGPQSPTAGAFSFSGATPLSSSGGHTRAASTSFAIPSGLPLNLPSASLPISVCIVFLAFFTIFCAGCVRLSLRSGKSRRHGGCSHAHRSRRGCKSENSRHYPAVRRC